MKTFKRLTTLIILFSLLANTPVFADSLVNRVKCYVWGCESPKPGVVINGNINQTNAQTASSTSNVKSNLSASSSFASSFTTTDLITIKNAAEFIKANQDSTRLLIENQAKLNTALIDTLNKIADSVANRNPTITVGNGGSPPAPFIVGSSENQPLVVKTVDTQFNQAQTGLQNLINTINSKQFSATSNTTIDFTPLIQTLQDGFTLLASSTPTSSMGSSTIDYSQILTTINDSLLLIASTTEKVASSTNNNMIPGLSGSNIPNSPNSSDAPIAIADLASGGNIGTAATTVDVSSMYNLTQTTINQTITLPNPTVTTGGRLVSINNTGTASFSFYGQTVVAGNTGVAFWNGTAWQGLPPALVGSYGIVTAFPTIQFITSTTFVDVTGSSFTLPSAGTYKVTYYIEGGNGTANGILSVIMTDNSGTLVPNSVTNFTSPTGNARGVLTTSVLITVTGPTTYKLQAATGAATTAFIDNRVVATPGVGGSNIVWQQLSGYIPSAGETVDYVNVYLNASTNILNNAPIVFTNVFSGNIPYNTTTGQFTLTAGKTYRLSSNVSMTTNASNMALTWFNVTAGAALGPSGMASSAGNPSTNQADVVFTPTVTTVVELRNTQGAARVAAGAAIGTASSVASQATIVQVGSTAVTTKTTSVLSANKSSAQTFAGAASTVTGWTTVVDTTNSFNATTGVWTCPRNGNYLISADMLWGNNAWAGGNIQSLIIRRNAVNIATEIWTAWAAQTSQYPSRKMITLNLVAGDTIDVQMASGRAGGATINASAVSNTLSIVEILPQY